LLDLPIEVPDDLRHHLVGTDADILDPPNLERRLAP